MPECSIVAWNLHWGRSKFVGGADGAPYDVVGPLRAYDADCYVLPEYWRDHAGHGLADPLRELGYEILEVPFIRMSLDGRPRAATPGEGWWCLAIVTRLPILDHEMLPIGRGIHDPAGARAALRVGIDVDGARLDVVGIHTSSKLWWGNPIRHLRNLRPHLRALASRPAVVAGDCNMWGPVVERVLPGWSRTTIGPTWGSPRPHSQIDHVLANDHVTFLRGEVLGPTASDHRAIRARVRLAEPSRTTQA